MQRIDLLIVGALVVAAAASGLGVLTYEDDRAAAFGVTWTTSDADVEAEGGPSDFTADVTALNVTRAVWTVTVSGAPARVQPVAVRVDVTAPDNTTTSAEGELPAGATTSAEIPVEVDLGTLPTLETATGASLDAARAGLPVATNGTGAWRISVLVSTGPVPEQVATSVAGVITTYAAELSTAAPEVARG